MQSLTARNALWIALATGFGAVLEFFAILHYLDVLPGDTLGIVVQSLVCICVIVLAGIYFRTWLKLRQPPNDD